MIGVDGMSAAVLSRHKIALFIFFVDFLDEVNRYCSTPAAALKCSHSSSEVLLLPLRGSHTRALRCSCSSSKVHSLPLREFDALK